MIGVPLVDLIAYAIGVVDEIGCLQTGAFFQDAPGLAADLLGRDAQLAQHFTGFIFGRTHNAEQQVLGADVMVVHAPGFVDGKLQHLLGAGGEVDARVGERADVPRGDPHLAGQDDRGVQADDVLASVDHRLPPLPLDVLLELDTQRPVVPGRARPSVDLPARENEAPALAEADDGVDGGGARSHAGQVIGPAAYPLTGFRRRV